jgi:hypothetical protein
MALNNMTKKTWFFGGAMVGAIIVVIVVLSYIRGQTSLGLESHEFTKFESDVVGTRVVTTTVGVGFRVTATGGISATSSYITKISGVKENAIYTFMPTHASTTAKLQFNIWGSNDAYCDTTAISGGNLPLMSEIHWFSAGDHLQNRSHLVNLLNDSSTSFLNWENPTSTAATEILLTNLNFECLKLDVAGSSTVLYAAIRTK